nr:disease resistance protein RPP13-like isoform X6 [Ipomoea batatas]
MNACDLNHWKASSQNFPKLEHLYIECCCELREIPIGFAEISTLKSIKLWRCLPSAVESAKKIQDEQRDYGNNDMVVIEEDTFNAEDNKAFDVLTQRQRSELNKSDGQRQREGNSNSYLLSNSSGPQGLRTGSLSICLASPDGRVIGGGVGGVVIAASPVQVILGSFMCWMATHGKEQTPGDLWYKGTTSMHPLLNNSSGRSSGPRAGSLS